MIQIANFQTSESGYIFQATISSVVGSTSSLNRGKPVSWIFQRWLFVAAIRSWSKTSRQARWISWKDSRLIQQRWEPTTASVAATFYATGLTPHSKITSMVAQKSSVMVCSFKVSKKKKEQSSEINFVSSIYVQFTK